MAKRKRMTEEVAFLSALASDPTDAVTRAVYSDWLEERGDPRGEYLRLFLTMAALDPAGDAHAALVPRRTELRNRLDAAWMERAGCAPRHRPLFTKLPDDRIGRWRLVAEFIDVWHGPLLPGDGCTEEEIVAIERRLGFRLPAALREWHALAGKRMDGWSYFNHLLRLEERSLERESGDLVIMRECQNCERWAIRATDLALDDPPIVQLIAGNECIGSTSAFACHMVPFNAKFRGDSHWGGVDAESQYLPGGLSRCGLLGRYRFGSPLPFWEGVDLLVETCDGWIEVAAHRKEALEQLGAELLSRIEFYG